MMIFNTLWTTLLGVIGGIVSSFIVSRVFLIQGEYNTQIKFVENIIRKIGSISAYLQCAKAICKVSYDQNVAIEKEMKEKGYKCEVEYYVAHSDKDWISKNDVLEIFRTEIDECVKLIHNDLSNNHVNDNQLNSLIHDIGDYVRKVSSLKDYTFSEIDSLLKERRKINEQYETCLHMSGKKLFRLLAKDKVMIMLYFIVWLLIIGTIISWYLGI